MWLEVERGLCIGCLAPRHPSCHCSPGVGSQACEMEVMGRGTGAVGCVVARFSTLIYFYTPLTDDLSSATQACGVGLGKEGI